MTAPPDDCLARNDWICGAYLTSRREILRDAVLQHLQLTAVSVCIGLLLALPLALAARRLRWAAGPVLGVTTILYTVPSLAMFSLLLPVYGLSASLVVAGLVLYSLTLLVRNILAGLRAVPEETRQAARGMGYGPVRLLVAVELPLALPAASSPCPLLSSSVISARVGHSPSISPTSAAPSPPSPSWSCCSSLRSAGTARGRPSSPWCCSPSRRCSPMRTWGCGRSTVMSCGRPEAWA
ncbi:ABC transporter permease subunit [Streptomyces sp. NBC_01669]|uniref:ABC transporter permease n=1 Tax=Streptomyces sp. NBC_01669 TaxID=2975909 RepID=UPI00338F7DE2